MCDEKYFLRQKPLEETESDQLRKRKDEQMESKVRTHLPIQWLFPF